MKGLLFVTSLFYFAEASFKGCERFDSDELGEHGPSQHGIRWVDVKCEDSNITTLNADFLLESVIDLQEFLTANIEYDIADGPRDAGMVQTKPPPTYSVTLRNSNIQDIADGTFEVVPTLQSLDVSSNQLGSVRKEMFRGLRNLNDLSLQRNKIKDLDFAPFYSLENLRYLSLSENQLTELKFYNFMGLQQSNTLNLERNNISVVNAGAFGYMRNLENLFASENRIRVLDGSVLAGLFNIRYLILRSNEIEMIYDGAFRGMNNLELLSLKGNILTQISASTFAGLANVRRIDLSSNMIQTIEGSPFSDCPLLEELDLSHNGLTTLRPEMFLGLINLKYVDFQQNWMHETAAEVLDEINFHNSTLIETISMFCRYPGMKLAQFAYNGLQELIENVPFDYLGFNLEDELNCAF